MESKRITAYVKHKQSDRQQNKNIASKKPYSPENLVDDEQQDQFICPMGKPMVNTGSYTRTTKAGFVQEYTRCEMESYKWCRLRQVCHGQKGNRVIEVNHNLRRLKGKANKRLKTPKGINKRKQRCFDVEPVFSSIKHNHQFKRFMLRGIKKVEVETGLLALAHNLRKKAA